MSKLIPAIILMFLAGCNDPTPSVPNTSVEQANQESPSILTWSVDATPTIFGSAQVAGEYVNPWPDYLQPSGEYTCFRANVQDLNIRAVQAHAEWTGGEARLRLFHFLKDDNLPAENLADVSGPSPLDSAVAYAEPVKAKLLFVGVDLPADLPAEIGTTAEVTLHVTVEYEGDRQPVVVGYNNCTSLAYPSPVENGRRGWA